MQPALTLSTRRAKSSNCLLNQCYFELERNKRSFLTCITTARTTTTTKRPPHLPALWFLVTRSGSSKPVLPVKKYEDIAYSKFHPHYMNKEIDLEELSQFLSTCTLSPGEIYKSLRTALYNTSQYNSEKAWSLYESMIHYKVDNFLTCNNYGHLLCILKYRDSVPRMLTVLKNMKRQEECLGQELLTSYHISQVLFAMSRQGLVKEACELIKSTFTISNLYPTANHYHSLAVAFKKSNNHKAIKQVVQLLVEGMQQRETMLHNTTISIMISLLSSQNQSQSMDLTVQFLKAVDQVKSSNSIKDEGKEEKTDQQPYNVYIYTSLIAGFARQGDSETAKRIYREMRRHKVEPNQVTFSAMMEAYSSAGDFTSAIYLLTDHHRRHRTLSTPMLTSLLVNAIRHNNLTVARNTARFISRKKMPAKDMDSMLRTSLIWLKTQKSMENARRNFDRLYKMDKNFVNHIMVNHLVKGYGNKKDKSNVITSYNFNEKLPPTTVQEQVRSKHYLTNALFHCRDIPAAIGVFISMRNQAVPDDVTLAMVIQGLIVNNENNLAWRLFKTLQADGIEPNLHAYTSMLKIIGHRESDYKKKQNAKLDPDMIAAAGIRSANLDYLNSEVPSTTEAFDLFRRMTGFQQPNVYTYTTLISCFAKNDISRAISIFDHMCARGVQPIVETYTAILQGCAIFRNSQMAFSVFNHMCESQVEPNEVTWRYLLKSLLRSRVDKMKIEKVAAMARESLDRTKVD